MVKIRGNNYIAIQGWMRTDLDLKGNELMAYALIYGFSQDGFNEFACSITYLQEWLGCSRPTAIATLDKLCEKGLVVKNEIFSHGQVCNSYTTQTGTTEIVPSVEKTDKQKEKKPSFIPPTLEEVKAYCKERNNDVDPVRFYEFYNEANWHDGKGQKVKNWKQKLITWEGRGNNTTKPKTKKHNEKFGFEGRDYNFDELEAMLLS